MIDWILSRTAVKAPAPVADVGCGTGIAARAFSARGLTVIGLDPNAAMLAEARRREPGDYRLGEAASTGLGDRSMALIIAGQAFHWFDLAAAMKEFARILKPGGWCAAFWNKRLSTPFLDEYEALLTAHCEDYQELPDSLDTIPAIARFAKTAGFQEAEFSNRQKFDRDGFFGRVYSSSYVALGLRRKAEFDAALGALFDRYQIDNQVEFEYKTLACVWQIHAG